MATWAIWPCSNHMTATHLPWAIRRDALTCGIRAPKTARTLQVAGAGINQIAFSPDGMTLAAGARDGVVRSWDPINGNLIRSFAWIRDEGAARNG